MDPAFSPTQAIASLAGGVGLFLLGMHLLTEGLKFAAGAALEDLLEDWTSTRLRGLAAGILITTLVQSSSAVTVATIGFVNAGLLTLRNAIWVIFGSNVGTTMNAWLVATLGFSFEIDRFAHPIVGAGAVLLLGGRAPRLKALGQALAGFGVLFIGIQTLQTAFAGIGDQIRIADYVGSGFTGYAILVLLGTVMTVLMQASGAAIAIIITAAQGGVLPIEAACAMVIGTNVGTTTTAVLSALGATAGARRVAAAHVLFNLITGSVALLLLLPLVQGIDALRSTFGPPPEPAVVVALFHTVFNVLGVALMVSLDPWMLRTLAHRFRRPDEDEGHPLYLDTNVLAVSDLAMRALQRELARAQHLASAVLRLALHADAGDARLLAHQENLRSLAAALRDYARRMSAAHLASPLVEELAPVLAPLSGAAPLAEQARTFIAGGDDMARAADPPLPDHDAEAAGARLATAELQYERLKESLLVAGADAAIKVREMQDWLRTASLQRRALQQLTEGAQHLQSLVREQPLPQDAEGTLPGETA